MSSLQYRMLGSGMTWQLLAGVTGATGQTGSSGSSGSRGFTGLHAQQKFAVMFPLAGLNAVFTKSVLRESHTLHVGMHAIMS